MMLTHCRMYLHVRWSDLYHINDLLMIFARFRHIGVV